MSDKDSTSLYRASDLDSVVSPHVVASPSLKSPSLQE